MQLYLNGRGVEAISVQRHKPAAPRLTHDGDTAVHVATAAQLLKKAHVAAGVNGDILGGDGSAIVGAPSEATARKHSDERPWRRQGEGG